MQKKYSLMIDFICLNRHMKTINHDFLLILLFSRQINSVSCQRHRKWEDLACLFFVYRQISNKTLIVFVFSFGEIVDIIQNK